MTLLEATNAVGRFVLELCALAAFGYWGFRASDSGVVEWALGLVLPFAFAMLWGAYVAPKAPLRLPDPYRFGLELAVFALAAVALYDAGSEALAVIFAVAVAANLAAMLRLDQRRSL